MRKSQFFTFEYLVYITITVIGFSWLFWEAHRFSNPKLDNYKNYYFRLQEGWLFGRMVDNSDAQYAGFRNNIKLLLPVMVLHSLLSNLFKLYDLEAKNQCTKASLSFNLLFALIFLTVLYGTGVIKILIFITFFYGITKTFGYWKMFPIVVWIFAISTLFLNDYYNGYKFENLHKKFYYLDNYNGIQKNCMDYYWMLRRKLNDVGNNSYDLLTFSVPTGKKLDIFEEHCKKCQECNPKNGKFAKCAKYRIEDDLNFTEYNYFNYLSYCTYTPLYMAGPIITFNDFICQVNKVSSAVKLSTTVIYGFRWLFCFFLMEIILHGIYVVAISKSKAWSEFTPFQISAVGFINLKLIWLKLLIIWRFFRFWALCDGIIASENMTRCMSNNYSTLGFWRSWHRSFNRWIAAKELDISMFHWVESQVWHDISLKLLAWGWLITLFILPEIIATKLFNPYSNLKYFKYLKGIGAVFNIYLMMIANLVGFALGLEGMKIVLVQIFNISGIFFVFGSFTVLFSLSQIMFELRKIEFLA
ncbi:glycerol transporter [Lobulomyces angularis]|nr:glycerol transporter [Lobulomyces angularis]